MSVTTESRIGDEQYTKAVETANARYQTLVDRAKAEHPAIAERAAESGVPTEISDLALALGKNWAAKPMDNVLSRATRLNSLGNHPGLNGLVEEQGTLNSTFSNDRALRRDVTQRVAMMGAHELMSRQNGSGPVSEKRPGIRQTAGELAVAVVQEVLDMQDRREKAVGHIAPRVDFMSRVPGEVPLTEIGRNIFRGNTQPR